MRRKAITIRRKLRVKATQTNHIRSNEFDVDKEFEIQEEYKKQLEEFSYWKSLVSVRIMYIYMCVCVCVCVCRCIHSSFLLLYPFTLLSTSCVSMFYDLS